jgi:hypothetical protein
MSGLQRTQFENAAVWTSAFISSPLFLLSRVPHPRFVRVGVFGPVFDFSAVRFSCFQPNFFTPGHFSAVPPIKLLTTWYSCATKVRVVRSP